MTKSHPTAQPSATAIAAGRPRAAVHELTPAEARQIAVQAQLLGAQRPVDLLETVRHLTLLQVDPTATVAPSADLVAWSRLGAPYRPADLVVALGDRRLVELRAMIRPSEDLALYRDEMALWPGEHDIPAWRQGQANWVDKNDACRRDILDRLTRNGPLPSRELPDSCSVPWKSTGWNKDRNVGQLLEMMVLRGEVAIAGRLGRDRLWDLASRVYPDDPIPPAEQARRTRDGRRLRALGIARARGPECPVEPSDVGEAGEPAVIEGVRGTWRVDSDVLAKVRGQQFMGRAALLSPFDRLIHDRKRMAELFQFDYQVEIYKPVNARRWGYFALPVLFGDRLVGKVDATADRQAGALDVAAIHRDVEFTPAMRDAVDAEICDLAGWLGLLLRMP